MEIPVIKNSGRNYLNMDRDKQLRQACEDFEAYFYEMVFKSARKTIQDGGLIKNLLVKRSLLRCGMQRWHRRLPTAVKIV